MNELTLKPILSEAWQKVKGAKRAFFWVFLVLACLQFFLYSVRIAINEVLSSAVGLDILVNLIFLFICTPFITGFAMLGVKRACGEKIHAKQGYAYFKKIIPLFVVQIMTLITLWLIMYCVAFGGIGGVMLLRDSPKAVLIAAAVIIGIIAVLLFITVITSFCFTYILVADQNKSPWQAYKGSIKMTFPHLKVLVMAEIIFLLLDVLGAIPAGIGLIWTIPFSYIATGIFYREILASQKTK